MADNKPEGESTGGQDRKRSRRYLRNRKRSRRAPKREENDAKSRRPAGGADDSSQVEEQKLRRRRRRRARKESSPESQADVSDAAVNLDYVAPSSVFIYTHIVRSGLRDIGYEFHSERFGATGVGRRLEDYQLDLSVLFPEGGSVAQEAAKAAVPERAPGEPEYDDDEDYDEYDEYDEYDPEDEPSTPHDGV